VAAGGVGAVGGAESFEQAAAVRAIRDTKASERNDVTANPPDWRAGGRRPQAMACSSWKTTEGV
jgi:hypothetical protein